MACALRRYEVTDSGNWLPQEKYVQTVPTFNKQCYVVPSGTAKVYEEGDEASGSVYIAPLFHRVREAIAQGSSYVAPAAVSWHKTNNCLGCHIQTQTLLGLESSIGKADVDEDIAAYLLNEIINSQLSDGAIRRSHPEYAKNQTAFALWALSFVPDRQATFDTRAKALSFLWERKLSANGTTYWTNDHSSGWLNNADAMTALVALGASRYIQDAQEQDDLTAEQQSVVDHYTGVLDNIADYVLNRSHLNEDGNLPNALRLAALGELRNVLLLVSPDNSKLDAIIADMQDLDVLLRARQETDGGWNLKASGNTSDPLTSAWVGLALNYLHPPLNDQAVLDNIEYLLSSQQPDGTWITSSKLFTTRLATTSLVMSYLPVALEHLGNPDVSAGHILLTEQNDGTNTLSAVIQNRGLSDVTVPVLVNFYNGAPENNHLLGQVALDQIASNQSLKPSITIADAELTDDVYVTLTVAAEASECDITNNQSIAALVRVRATDPGQLFDTQVYTLNVDDVNQAPVITSEAPTELQGGQSFDYQIISTDDDVADAHSYRLIQGPDGLYLDPHSGRFTSAPGGIEPGNYSVTVQVTDLRGESVEQTFTLVVYANLPPQITSAPVIHGNNDSGYHYDIEATDPNEGDVLQYTYNTGPDGLAVNADSGVVGWNDIAVSLVEGKTDTNLFCLGEPAKIIGQFEPVVMWSKDQFDIGGTEILGPVLVGQMTDDNNDGVINSLDDTDVVMLGTEGSRTFIAVLDGATGTPHWINFDYNNNGIGSAAIADLDKDGKPEIYVLSYRRQTLMVIDNKGNLIRETETGLPYFSGSSGVRDGVTIADLDEDGNAEIIVGRNVLNGDGTIRWKGTKDYGGDTTYALIPVVADINLDGQQEVIAGRTIYSSTGEVLSHNTSIPSDGFNAIGNFNDDDYAEIVTVGNGSISLRDHNGQLIWGPESIPGGGFGGSPTVGDFDGDGLPEIGVAGANYYVVYEHDGTLKWQSQTRDSSSHRTGSSLFDFEGDGAVEVVYADEYYLRIYDGATGDVRMEVANRSGTTLEYPVIADIDNDDHAEILVGSNQHGGLRAFEDTNDSWAPTRAIWNQHAYHIDNVNDDLTIPAHPVNSWLTHNTFRLNAFPDRPALGLPDLTVHGIAYDEDTQTLTARIKNRGLAPVNEPITVSFIHEHFWTGDEALGQVAIDSLNAGEDKLVSLSVDDSSILQNNVRAEVTPNDNVNECLTDNNHARAAMIDARVYDEAGLYDSQVFAVSVANEQNNAPEIISSSTSQAVAGNTYQFQIEVSDVDLGDDVQFSLVDEPINLSIDEYSGVLNATGLVEGIYTFTVRATDLSGAVAEQAHILTVSAANNNAPVINSAPSANVTLGHSYTYQVEATDPDGDDIVYLLSRNPSGMTINGATGEIRWSPDADHLGVNTVEVTAIDAHGGAAKQYFLIEVLDTNVENQSPTINSVPSGAAYAGQVYQYQVEANDPDGDDLFYSVSSSASDMVISSTGLFTWLPSAELMGQAVIVEIQVADSKGATVVQKLTLPVNEGANHAPLISSTPKLSAKINELYRYAIDVSDADSDPISIVLLDKPEGMVLNNNTLEWTPAIAQSGANYDVAVKALDARGAASIQSFSITVTAANKANNAPEITSQPTSPAIVGEQYSYNVVATDEDGDELTFTLQTGPQGMTLSSTGELRWTPTADQIGSHSINIAVSDGVAQLSQSYTLEVVTVEANNNAPEITSQPTSPALVDKEYQYDVIATDADGDALTYTLSAAPDGMTLSATGALRWTPNADQVGSHPVAVSVSDGLVKTTQSYTLEAIISNPDNNAPVISSLPPSPAIAGEEYRYDVAATDADGDTLTYVLADAPQGMSLSTSGELRWTPTADQIGTYSVTLSVSDGQIQVTQTFVMDVIAEATDNHSPVISSIPATFALADEQYRYTLTASDSDADALTYGLLTSPSGMTISAAGEVQWLPTQSQLGEHSVTLFVSDGISRALQSYSLTVNTAAEIELPYLANKPTDEATVNQQYSYKILALDANGYSVNVELLNGPEGMVLIQNSRHLDELRWTPAEGDCLKEVTLRLSDRYGQTVETSYTITVH
ncbi:MAG: putative Ig domain-containing protein, partial [Reinekea sp.]